MVSQCFPNSIPTESQADGLTAAGAEEPGAVERLRHQIAVSEFWIFDRSRAEDKVNRNQFPAFGYSSLDILGVGKTVYLNSS